MTTSGTFRRTLREAVELFLVPGIAALLPWGLAFRLFRWLCKHPFLYEADCRLALAHASNCIPVPDPKVWLFERRLTTLVDHADCYLSLFRSDAWIRKHLQVDGEWAGPGQAALLLTFHWSAGMWGLRHARSVGLSPHMLLAKGPSVASPAGLYARLRTYAVARATGNAAFPVPVRNAAKAERTPFDFPRMERLYQDNHQLLAVIDVPPDQVGESVAVSVMGHRAHAPIRLLRDARQRQIPIVVYRTGLDLRTGRRRLVIRNVPPMAKEQELADAVFRELDEALAESTAAWHFWAIAPRFFSKGSS